MPPPLIGGALSDAFVWRLSVWRLSIAYIGNNWRTERPRKSKIGTEVAHVTRDSDTTFTVKRSKVKVTKPVFSPRRLHTGSGQRSAWERIERGKLLLRCRLQARGSARRREALRRPQGEERPRGAGAYRVATRTACSRKFRRDRPVTFWVILLIGHAQARF